MGSTSPFPGDETLEVLKLVAQTDPEPPRKLNPKVPRDLETICLKCLRKEPDRRYSSAKDLADDLDRFLRYEAILARPVGPAEKAWLWACRHPARAGLLLGFLLALLLAGAWGASSWSSRDETERVVGNLVREAGNRKAEARQAPLEKLPDLLRKQGELAKQADQLARHGPSWAATRQRATEALTDARADAEADAKDRALLNRLLELLIFGTGGAASWEHESPVRAQMADADRLFAAALRDWGLDPDQVPVPEAAARIRSRPAAVAVELVAALDQWAYVRRTEEHPGTQRLYDLANEADEPDAQRRELRGLLAGSRVRGTGARLDKARLLALAQQVRPDSEPTLTLLVLARALWEVQEHDRMEAVLRAAVNSRPRDALLRADLGGLYLMRGALADSAGGGKMAEAFLGGSLPAWWWKQAAPASARESRYFQEAVVCFDALRTLRPEAELPLAVALLSTPRRDEGLDMLRRLKKSRKDDPLLQLLEAEALLRQGDLQGAAKAAEQGALAGGLGGLGDIARLQAGLAAVQAKDWDKAAAHCEEVLRSAKNPQLRALAYVGLGAAHHGRGQTAERIQAFGEALRLLQGIPSGHVWMAQQLEQAGDLQGAEKLLARGLKEDPGNAALKIYIALRLRRRGRHDEARAVQKELGRLPLPSDKGSLFKCGCDLVALQEFALAEKAFRKVLDSDPDHFLANAYLSGSLNSQGKHEEAQKYADKVIRLRPTHYLGPYLRGWSFYARKRLDEAVASLRQAVGFEPETADPFLMLGSALLARKQPREAEPFLRKGLTLDPKHRDGHFWLSMTLREQGKLKEAEEELKKAEQLRRATAP